MTKWNGTVHPAADLFPMLPDAELQALADDIAKHGLDHPIVLTSDGTLLDGRNRKAACEMAGVELRWRVYDKDDHVRYVMSNGLKRRDLTAGQKAALAVDLLPLYEAEALKRMADAGRSAAPGKKAQKGSANVRYLSPHERRPKFGKAAQSAADDVGVSSRAVETFKALQASDPDLANEVRAGRRSLNDGVATAKRRADKKAKAEAKAAVQEQRDDALLAQLAEQAQIEAAIRKAESERAVSDQLLDELVQRVQSINALNFNVIATSSNTTLLGRLKGAWNEAAININKLLEGHQ